MSTAAWLDAHFGTARLEYEAALRWVNILPGWRVADATHLQMHPFDADVLARYLLGVRHQHAEAGVLGTACGTILPTWLDRSGFAEIRRRGWLIERWAPLNPYAQEFVQQLLTYCASRASNLDLSDQDKRYWAAMSERPSKLLDDPHFCLREVHVVAIGRKGMT